MSEMSDMHKLIMAMELAKTAQVGLELTYFDVIELLGELESLKDYIAELEMKIRHNALWQASEDAEERAHLEKLVPDLKKRIAELEALVERLIELGDVINGDKDSVWTLQTIKECWTEDVTKWKERE